MPVPSSSEIIDALVDGTHYWASGQFTYSIPGGGASWSGYTDLVNDEPYIAGYSVFNNAQATQFRLAISLWDNLIAENFTETNDATSPGNIRVAFTDVSGEGENVWGYAYYPNVLGNPATTAKAGDIWIGQDQAGSDFAVGSYDFNALLHEIGHALGLKHPFEEPGPLATEYDNTRYTLMSYTDFADILWLKYTFDGSNLSTAFDYVDPTTPMLFDVVAIQSLYGVSTTTNAGDTTYTWSQDQAIMECLFDSGGVDTFDFSAHTRGSIIDLTPGAFSSVAYWSAASQNAYWVSLYSWASSFINGHFTTYASSVYTWSNNLSIAYTATIENAIGSSAADTLSGNSVANQLEGRNGADTLMGRGGDDVLKGGAGSDMAIWTGSRADFFVRAFYSGGVWYLAVGDQVGSEGTDTVDTVEIFRFNGVDFGFYGVQGNRQSNFDGGRFDDVLFQNAATGAVWSKGGNDSFAVVIGALSANWTVRAFGDVTGDGRADVIAQNTTNGAIYFYDGVVNGAGSWTTLVNNVSSAFEVVDAGDVTGDGTVDLLVRNNSTGNLLYLDLNAGGANGGWGSIVNVGLGWKPVAFGDFNLDGKSDVMIQETATGKTYYRNIANGTWGSVSGSVGTDWVAKAAGDINGDGYYDVVFQNIANGKIWWMNMAGGAGANKWGVVANNMLGWDVIDVLDVDNDGWGDVIVQNQSNGETYYANMDNGAFSGWGFIAGAIGTDWDAV